MLSRSESKLLKGLRRRRVREREGRFLAEGVRLVEDLLGSRLRPRLAVVSPTLEDAARGRELARALEDACEVRRVDDAALRELGATKTTQGVLVAAEIPRSDLAGLRVRGPGTLLVLDGVQDPGNFGTLARTAEAFGAIALAALRGTVDPWNPKAVRAAAGASFRVPIVRPDFGPLRDWLHRHGFTLYGAAADGTPVDECELAQRSALVVGNEGAGLSPEVRGAVDAALAVPIRGEAESLNVAVAAGIVLYLLTRSE